mmetsp:Transcript_90071/g.150588  ORF Transcript_90071/g.150588 Transcript_90071/m.150588 type:complete len:90 (+) Transcript_90071:208-477(+)
MHRQTALFRNLSMVKKCKTQGKPWSIALEWTKSGPVACKSFGLYILQCAQIVQVDAGGSSIEEGGGGVPGGGGSICQLPIPTLNHHFIR